MLGGVVLAITGNPWPAVVTFGFALAPLFAAAALGFYDVNKRSTPRNANSMVKRVPPFEDTKNLKPVEIVTEVPAEKKRSA